MSKYLDWSATRSSADIRIQSADDEPTPRFGLVVDITPEDDGLTDPRSRQRGQSPCVIG
jgi:hypothetical protein